MRERDQPEERKAVAAVAAGGQLAKRKTNYLIQHIFKTAKVQPCSLIAYKVGGTI